jgi:Asp-tRNA(Asn)/Glu-tRNA(Gln) amidotransferase A subunit family amidase
MAPAIERNEQSPGSKLSRRQFLKLTGTTIAAGMTSGVVGIPRLANAGGFADYLNYDGLGLADLVRRKEVKPEELLEAAITRIDMINPKLKEVETNPGKLKIAFFTKGSAEVTHPDCIAAVTDTATLCESLGHTVEEAAPNLNYEPLRRAFGLVLAGHTAAALDGIERVTGQKVTADMVEPWTWYWAKFGWQASAAQFAGTKRILNRATRAVASFLTKYDVILTPTLGAPPPKLGYFDTVNTLFGGLEKRFSDHNQFAWLHNVTGLPAMSVPLFWNAEGLPIGVQFAGRYADESTLYRLAGQLEEARPWREKIPSIAL